jgi:hypothetical protein
VYALLAPFLQRRIVVWTSGSDVKEVHARWGGVMQVHGFGVFGVFGVFGLCVGATPVGVTLWVFTAFILG